MVTVESFRAAFPVYTDRNLYPDAQIQFYLDLGYKLHDPVRWGDILDYGVSLWTAHSLAMDAQSVGTAPGAIRGAVTSMSADGVSWSRDIGSAMNPKAGHWNLSSFGLRWRGLYDMFGAGPIYVGAPSLYDAYLSGSAWAWPGPDPYNQT